MKVFKITEDIFMKNNSDVSIRKIQDKMLEILVYFQHFCDENNLPFVLAGGTCLGAVRHGGFIPWDDDVYTSYCYRDKGQ